MPAPGTLHTTTARFDAEMWAAIEHHSDRLGIAHAEFIRGAVHHRLAHLDHTDRLTRLEQRVEAVAPTALLLIRCCRSTPRSYDEKCVLVPLTTCSASTGTGEYPEQILPSALHLFH